MIRHAYTSTVVGSVPVGLGIVCSTAAGVVTVIAHAPIWVTAALVVAALVAAADQSTVRLSVGEDTVVLCYGPWEPPRPDYARRRGRGRREHQPAVAAGLRLGGSVPPGDDEAHRPGRADASPSATQRRAHPDQYSGPGRRAHLAQSNRTGDTMTGNSSRPWFAPKRVGYGLRPQTWQGWTIVAAFSAAVIIIALIVSH